MLNDFIPIIHKFNAKDIPGNKITIVPLADAHYGSQEFNEVLWHKTIARIYEDPNCYCVIVGDMIDNGLKNSVTDIYAATASPKKQKEWLREELKPIAKKILAAVGGNHERRTIKEADQDPLYDVMVSLGLENIYRQNVCFMQIKMMHPTTNEVKYKQRNDFTFAITHGAGGGMYIGSSANKVQRFGEILEGIDCLITAHTHKPLTFPACKLVFDGSAKRILQRQFTVVVASSFVDYGGYPVQKLLPPTAKTTTEIVLTYTGRGNDKKIKVIQ